MNKRGESFIYKLFRFNFTIYFPFFLNFNPQSIEQMTCGKSEGIRKSGNYLCRLIK